jgi:predicted O-methyltransferase YrrM
LTGFIASGRGITWYEDRETGRATNSDSLYFERNGRAAEHLYFAAIATVLEATNVLEIGTGLGVTTSVLARLWPDAAVTTVDTPSRSAPRIQDPAKFSENISKAHNILLVEMDSLELPERMNQTWDVVFVDGDHMYPRVLSDMKYSYDCLTEGGFILAHDYGKADSQVEQAVDDFAQSIPETVHLLPFSCAKGKHPLVKIAWLQKGEL